MRGRGNYAYSLYPDTYKAFLDSYAALHYRCENFENMLKKTFALSLLLAVFTSANTARAQAKSAEADFKEHPIPPAVSMRSVLDGGFTIDLHDNMPYPHLLDVAFLPTKDVNGNQLFPSTQGPNDPLITAVVVKNSAGQVLYTEPECPIGSIRPVTSTTKCDFLQTEGDYTRPWPAGNYTMEYTVTGKVIFSMPFELIVGKNDDPYANKKEIRMIDGYWSKYGCYHFDNSTGVFIFNTWETCRDMTFTEDEHKSENYTVEWQLFYEGKPFSQLEKNTGTANRGLWEEKWTALYPVADKFKHESIKRADMKDGSYVMKMTLNGKDREYPFQIKAGKPVPISEQDRTKTTDPTKVFEGINQYWFVKNTKA